MTEADPPITAEQVSSALVTELEVDADEDLDSLLVTEAILVVEGLGLAVDERSLTPPVTVESVVEATHYRSRM